MVFFCNFVKICKIHNTFKNVYRYFFFQFFVSIQKIDIQLYLVYLHENKYRRYIKDKWLIIILIKEISYYRFFGVNSGPIIRVPTY